MKNQLFLEKQHVLRLISNSYLKRMSTKNFLKKTKKLFSRPTPRLKFGYLARNLLSSSMDSSDGLSTCLNELSDQSKKQFVITKLPVNSDLIDF